MQIPTFIRSFYHRLLSRLPSLTSLKSSTSSSLLLRIVNRLFFFAISIVFILLSPLLAAISIVIIMTLFLPLAVIAFAGASWYLLSPIKRKISALRSVEVDNPQRDAGLPRRNALSSGKLTVTPVEGINNLADLFRNTVEKFGANNGLGQRPTVKIEEYEHVTEKDGQKIKKMFTRPHKSEYKFMTYAEVGDEVARIGAGLVELGMKPGHMLSIYASTRPEWQMAAQACFAHNFPVVTVYASLGQDALEYGFNQTEVPVIVTEAALLSNVLNATTKCASINTVVYFDDLDEKKQDEAKKLNKRDIKIVSYKELLQLGKSKTAPLTTPKNDDTAVIMYTSGSTGNPKGVVITHGNLLAAVSGLSRAMTPAISPSDTFIAYLPLAHVLELAAELTVMCCGGAIGYSSTITLRDDQVHDFATNKPKGDLRALRPTLMAMVPAILDRLRLSVQETVEKSGAFKRFLFNTAYYIKRRNYLQGASSPLWDALVFKNIAARFGGRLRGTLSGGAPLSVESQEFMNICFCCPVLQGYGLTETCGGGTVTAFDELADGTVGGPISCLEIKLMDVKEMNYTSEDIDPETKQSRPRGEICIRGGNVTKGYYKMPDKTAECFIEGEDGKGVWFYTGDIGQWMPNGTLKIIDRKKDLVKLCHGEYIALGNLESVYVGSPLIDNICVFASPFKEQPAAFIVPNKKLLLEQLAAKGISLEFEAACDHEEAKKLVIEALNAEAKKAKLKKFEYVNDVVLVKEEWTPISGLVTEALKLKRKQIYDFYNTIIETRFNK